MSNVCKKCGLPKEASRVNSRLCRSCDHPGSKLKLKIRSGSFELWAQGKSRAFVMVAKGEVGEPHRVAVEIFSASGMNATHEAHKVFISTVAGYAAATR